MLSVITSLFLTGLFANLPEATLAAVVIAVVAKLVDFQTPRKYARLTTPDLRRIYGVAAYAGFLAAVRANAGREVHVDGAAPSPSRAETAKSGREPWFILRG